MYKSIDGGYEAMFVQDVLAEHKEREMREVIVGPTSYFADKILKKHIYIIKQGLCWWVLENKEN